MTHADQRSPRTRSRQPELSHRGPNSELPHFATYDGALRSILLACALLLTACGPGSLPGDGGDELAESGSDDTALDESGGTGPISTTEAGDDDVDSESTDDCGAGCETTGGPEQACDLLAQDCPEGEKCVPDPAGEAPPICVPVLGDEDTHDPCSYDPATRTDDCDADSFCWALPGQALSCHAFCDPELEPALCISETCLHALEPESAPLSLCVPGCDPLLQDCPEGAACYALSEYEFACLPSIGDAGLLEPCEHAQDCAPLHHCMEAAAVPGCAADKCCAPFCDAWEPNCEALPGSECVVWVDDPWCRNPLGLCLAPDWPGAC